VEVTDTEEISVYYVGFGDAVSNGSSDVGRKLSTGTGETRQSQGERKASRGESSQNEGNGIMEQGNLSNQCAPLPVEGKDSPTGQRVKGEGSPGSWTHSPSPTRIGSPNCVFVKTPTGEEIIYDSDTDSPRIPTACTAPRSSTPNNMDGVQRSSPFPFHPTKSRSTISSIMTSPTTPISTPTPVQDLGEIERILESCEPSLVHTIPVLAKLGIRSEKHLRAVGRLTEEIRNEQVKEEALKLGMTIVEWAILLDTVRGL